MISISTILFSLRSRFFWVALVVFGSACFYKGYLLTDLYQFEWDQERDARVVWDIVRNHDFTLLGPRAVGDSGFYLGPYWYYFLVPFYIFFDMDPIAGAWAAFVVGILTSMVFLYVAWQLYGRWPAFVVALWWSSFYDRISWNPMLVPVFTLLILYMVFSPTTRWRLLFLGLLVGIGLQIHFQMIFVVLMFIAYVCWCYLRRQLGLRELVISIASIFVTFLPIILFDFRNDWINSKAFFHFFTHSTTSSISFFSHAVHVFEIFLRAAAGLVMRVENLWLGGFIVLTGTLGWILQSGIRRVIGLWLLWSPFLFFLGFRGGISEYYFMIPQVLSLVGIACLLERLLSKSYLIVILSGVWLLFFLWQQYLQIGVLGTGFDLHYKKMAVSHIVYQQHDPIFNVSYSVPLNFDNGYRYLFVWYGKEPQDVPEGHLWSIVVPADSREDGFIAQYGNIGVVRR